MSRQRSSRSRKQRLPCIRDRANFIQPSTDIDSDEEVNDYFDDSTLPKRTIRSNNAPKKTLDSRDRRAQMDHNEQERGRRRELAILYEMIRTCITQDDIQKYLEGGPKSPSRLSYPQILQIACGNVEEDLHDMRALERVAAQCEALEQECRRRGISFAEGPNRDALMQRHRVTANAVHESLMKDKE